MRRRISGEYERKRTFCWEDNDRGQDLIWNSSSDWRHRQMPAKTWGARDESSEGEEKEIRNNVFFLA